MGVFSHNKMGMQTACVIDVRQLAIAVKGNLDLVTNPSHIQQYLIRQFGN
jgi:hypothetical protein